MERLGATDQTSFERIEVLGSRHHPLFSNGNPSAPRHANLPDSASLNGNMPTTLTLSSFPAQMSSPPSESVRVYSEFAVHHLTLPLPSANTANETTQSRLQSPTPIQNHPAPVAIPHIPLRLLRSLQPCRSSRPQTSTSETSGALSSPFLDPLRLRLRELGCFSLIVAGQRSPFQSHPTRPDGPRATQPVASDVRHFAKVHKRASLVQRRQSNVMRLSEEHDRLKEELRAMTERLEAAERQRQELESSRGKGNPRGF